MRYTDIIVRPILTEKTYKDMQGEPQIFTFQVNTNANKLQVKEAVEKLFEVKVDRVNIVNVRAKDKRMGKYAGKTSAIKKAIVKLAPGQTLNMEEAA